MTSLELADGGFQIPAADQLTYAANAYRTSATVTLNVTIPGDAGVDMVSCP
jgi:hypothetical protein